VFGQQPVNLRAKQALLPLITSTPSGRITTVSECGADISGNSVIIFGVSRPKNKSLEIMLFETSKIITHPVEPIDIALRE